MIQFNWKEKLPTKPLNYIQRFCQKILFYNFSSLKFASVCQFISLYLSSCQEWDGWGGPAIKIKMAAGLNSLGIHSLILTCQWDFRLFFLTLPKCDVLLSVRLEHRKCPLALVFQLGLSFHSKFRLNHLFADLVPIRALKKYAFFLPLRMNDISLSKLVHAKLPLQSPVESLGTLAVFTRVKKVKRVKNVNWGDLLFTFIGGPLKVGSSRQGVHKFDWEYWNAHSLTHLWQLEHCLSSAHNVKAIL